MSNLQKFNNVDSITLKDFQTLMESLDNAQQDEEKTVTRDTKASRREVWASNVEDIPMEKIEDVDNSMRSYVGSYILDRIDEHNATELSQEQIDRLAEEYLEWEKITDLLEARKAQMRTTIFNHINIKHEDSGDTPPEQIADKIASKKNKVSFNREGGGRASAKVDWAKLEEKMGTEKFHDSVCEAREVPAHIEYTKSEDKLLDAVHSGDISLEDMREVLIPGKWQTPKFVVRKIK